LCLSIKRRLRDRDAIRHEVCKICARAPRKLSHDGKPNGLRPRLCPTRDQELSGATVRDRGAESTKYGQACDSVAPCPQTIVVVSPGRRHHGRAALPAPIAIGLIVTIGLIITMGVAVIIIIAATRSTRRGRSHETESRTSNGSSGVVTTIMPIIAMMPIRAIIVDVPPVVANLLDLRG
jgi:hypothetical protein